MPDTGRKGGGMSATDWPYKPNMVQIETVQGCNRRCKFCGTMGIERAFHYTGVAHTLLTPAPAVRKRQVVAFSKALLNKARFSCVFIIQFYLKGLYVHSVHFPFNHPSRSSFLQLCCNFKPLCFDRFEIQTIIAIFFFCLFSQRLYLFPTFAFFII